MEPVSERQQILYRQVLLICWVFETGRPSFTALFRDAACARRTPQAADASDGGVMPELGLECVMLLKR